MSVSENWRHAAFSWTTVSSLWSGERHLCGRQLQGPAFLGLGHNLRRWRSLLFKLLRHSLVFQHVLRCTNLGRHCSIATKQMLQHRQHLQVLVVALDWENPNSRMLQQGQTVRVAKPHQWPPPRHSSGRSLSPTLQHWLQLASALARGPVSLRHAGLWAGATVAGRLHHPIKPSRVAELPASFGTCMKGRPQLLGKRLHQHGASRGSRSRMNYPCQTAAERSDSELMRPRTSEHQVASHPLVHRPKSGHWKSSSVLTSNARSFTRRHVLPKRLSLRGLLRQQNSASQPSHARESFGFSGARLLPSAPTTNNKP
mmetsp:Transcript_42936/g.82329  ORF Transcript_42936/g.82329 Transcript_42936/m.82329 type:complete len:313 (+) Transcript_42936:162-1100(+)